MGWKKNKHTKNLTKVNVVKATDSFANSHRKAWVKEVAKLHFLFKYLEDRQSMRQYRARLPSIESRQENDYTSCCDTVKQHPFLISFGCKSSR